MEVEDKVLEVVKWSLLECWGVERGWVDGAFADIPGAVKVTGTSEETSSSSPRGPRAMMGEMEPQEEMGLKHMDGLEASAEGLLSDEDDNDDDEGGSDNTSRGRKAADDVEVSEVGGGGEGVEVLAWVRSLREKCILGRRLCSVGGCSAETSRTGDCVFLTSS